MADAGAGSLHGGDAALPCPPEEQELSQRLRRLYPAVNQEETPLPRSWSPKDKYNYIGLSQGNLRVHYKGAGLGRRRRVRLRPRPRPGARRPLARPLRGACRAAGRAGSLGLRLGRRRVWQPPGGRGRLGRGAARGRAGGVSGGAAELRPRGGGCSSGEPWLWAPGFSWAGEAEGVWSRGPFPPAERAALYNALQCHQPGPEPLCVARSSVYSVILLKTLPRGRMAPTRRLPGALAPRVYTK